MTTPLLKVSNLVKKYPIKKALFKASQFVHAVNGVSFDIQRGEVLGIVGESGCGKSTTGKSILQLTKPTSGEVNFLNKEMTSISKKELHEVRKDIQMVFQNPMDSMNPKLTIREIVLEPLIAHKTPKDNRDKLISEVMSLVGLSENHLSRHPHQLSGGQLQRVGIARAIILKPKLVIADEPVSALDVSIQAQIINLLNDLQEELQLSYLFISHDLAVVEHIAHRVGVMYLGEMMELATKEDLFEKPLHPYTQALMSSIPKTDPDENKQRIILKGELPSPSNPPSGCKFHPRCIHAMDICKTLKPEFKDYEGRKIACHLYDS